MLRKYLTPMVQDDDGETLVPALCAVYSGTFSSDPGPDGARIVSADVTDDEHAAILAVDGVSEVVE